jgi:Uma2 family endonuclease
MVLELKRKQFDVTQYHQMIATGLLCEGDRLELIEGEILEMAAIGSRHSAQVNRLNRLLSGVLPDVMIAVQNPIELGLRSEPQPDIVLLRWRDDYYEVSHPTPEDCLLVIEVADSTLEFDSRSGRLSQRDVKAPMYSRSGIGEYWLVDLQGQAIECYRQPTELGYQQMVRYGRGGSLSPIEFPHLSLRVDQILG